MTERALMEALAHAIEQANAAGDGDCAQQLTDLQGRIVARISRAAVAAAPADRPLTVPLAGREQLARIARRISTEALSAELASERGDWAVVHATYELLAVLFAEYRLAYVQCLSPPSGAETAS